MKFTAFALQHEQPEGDILTETENAPGLAVALCCEQCGRTGRAGANEREATANALASGWSWRVAVDVLMPAGELLNISDLGIAQTECFCPRCAGDF